jgi:Nucleotidyl transferase AbiEii toxin, Type IV TA system
VSARDIGASIRQRILNKSRNQGRPFQELLQYFAMERFLYRLAKSPYSDRFVLKGALLLTAWRAPQSRPTMDIDLEGRVNNQLDHIKEVVGTVCEVDVEPDGIAFNRASIEVSRIKEDADYEGVRVQFHATLARARIPMQIDIGFGDVITPGPTDIEYPSLLDLPSPVLRAYPKETVVCRETGSPHGSRRPQQPNERLLRSRPSLPHVSIRGRASGGSDRRDLPSPRNHY